MDENPRPDPPSPPQPPPAADPAARAPTALENEAERLRREVAALRREVREAEKRLAANPLVRLAQVNERLRVELEQARADADTAAQELRTVSESSRLDAMTQLPNRELLLDRFASAIRSARRRGTRLALLFLDLNHLKQINDTLGHAVGDEALKRVAQCLVASVREVDTVSRHGGDEFLLLLAEIGQRSDATLVAEKVIAQLGTPSRLGAHVLRLSASIGISVYPDDGNDAETLIHRADAAMYRAKRDGLGRYAFYRPELAGELGPETSRFESLRQPLVDHEQALAEHERRHAELKRANEALVIELVSARKLHAAAEAARRRQSELLAMAARELADPLAPISQAAALLGRLYTDDASLRRVQQIIERQVAQMSRLVGDLADVSRAHAGELRLDWQEVDFAAVVEAAVEAARPAMDERLQRFGARLPAGRTVLDADPARLQQIVGNLLDNASKYTPAGGDVRLAVEASDEAVTVTVADSGIGISAEALPDIFEPFLQDVQAIPYNDHGLGIGLTVVHELVDAHGGTIVATSRGPGRGSEFVVTLPRRRPAAPAA